jgi:hypothetical protein
MVLQTDRCPIKACKTFGGSGPDITAHGSLDIKQEIQIQIQNL